MALVSPPIPVADDTPLDCELTIRRLSVNVQFRYYSDAAGTLEVVPRGGGTRDLVATNRASGFVGDFRNPTAVIAPFVSDVEGGTLSTAVSERWYELNLGSGFGQLTITAAGLGADAPGAATYRIVVDADGKSSI